MTPTMPQPDANLEYLFGRYADTRDPEFLAHVYDRTASRLLAVALHMTSSASLAEDAVQDTFLFVLENPDRWERDRPLRPWLNGILANKLRQTTHRATRAPDPARVDLPDSHGPLRSLESDEILEEIERAIEHLPQPYRSVVLLRLRNHLSPADIAVALDRSPSTVRTQLSRGIEMLRRLLPAGVAALLVSALTATRGLAMVRRAVLDRADTVQQLLQAERAARRLATLKLLLGSAAVVSVVLAATLLWPTDTSTPRTTASAALDAPDFTSDGSDPVDGRVAALPTLPPSTDPAGADPTRSAALAPASLEVSIRTADGRPLEGAPIQLEPLRGDGGFFVHQHSGVRGNWRAVVAAEPVPPGEHRHGITDAAGLCRVTDLAPGVWLLRALGETGAARVSAGGTLQAELAIPGAVHTVHGHVLSADGLPVSGAEIWACREHVSPLRHVIAHSDAQGKFLVTVARYTTVGVRHPGQSPVGRSFGPDDPSDPLVDFRFRGAGASLEGRVVDAQGAPVGGALVQIGHRLDAQFPQFAGAVCELTRPFLVTTDATGGFQVDGIAPGSTWLGARAPGHALVSTDIELERATTSTVELQLTDECTIHGRITDRDGGPLAGVEVRSGHRGGPRHRSTTTDEDGRYQLRGVSAERVRLQAVNYDGGFATRLVDCRAGQQIEWNASLGDDDLTIEGRILAADGQPFGEGWVARITAWEIDVQQLDPRGGFAIPISDREAHAPTTIRVYASDPRAPGNKLIGVPLLIERGVVAGTRGLELRIPAAGAPRAWVRGRLLDDAGRPPRAPIFLVRDDLDSSWRVRLDPLGPNGEFESGAIPAGDYALLIAARGGLRLGTFTAAPRETTDVGELQATRPPSQTPGDGRIACPLAIAHPIATTDAGEVGLQIRDAAGEVVFERVLRWPDDGYSRATAYLQPGRYEVTADTAAGAHGRRSLEVRDAAGPQRALRLDLRPAAISDRAGR